MVNAFRPDRALLVAALVVLLSVGCAGLGCDGASGDAAPAVASPPKVGAGAKASGHVPSLEVRVLATHPHDPGAFTQGLLYADGVLYESTGLHGSSSLRKVDLESGKVLEERDLAQQYFGEGLALVPRTTGDRLIQLTWQSGVALVWDRERFEEVGEHDYQGEGWGLTFDGSRLVMSDGSSWLTFRDPETFEPLSRVQVKLEGRPLSQLNELEWVDGSVWANVWGSTLIVQIDPETGEVLATADLELLYNRIDPAAAQRMDVLNGIAFRPAPAGESGEETGDGVFLVTGKDWPLLFEVTFGRPGS